MLKTMCKEGMLFNVKGILRGWLMLVLTLTRLVVEWALGRPHCELKHNGEGLPPSRRVCMEWNTTRGQGSLHLQERPPDKHEVLGGRPCKRKLPRLHVCKNDPLRGRSCKSEGGRARVSRSSPKVAKQGWERQWGGQFCKNEPPRWSCCRNKSGGGQGSGQCAGDGVYISKMVDNERKWLAYLVCSPCACFRAYSSPPAPRVAFGCPLGPFAPALTSLCSNHLSHSSRFPLHVVVVVVVVDLRLMRSRVFSESHVNTRCSNVDLQTYTNIHQYIKLASPAFVLSSTVDYIFCILFNLI